MVRQLTTQVAPLPVAGAACGIVLTIAAQRELRSLVFGVAALDPLTLAGTVIVLGVAAAIAALVPALRAARIDPSASMRDG